MLACVRAIPLLQSTRVARGNLFGAREKSRDKGTNAEAQTARGGSSCKRWIASRIMPGAEAPALGADQQQRRRGIVGHRRPAQADQIGVEPESRAPSRSGCPTRRRRSATRSARPRPRARPPGRSRPITCAWSGIATDVRLVAPGAIAWSNSMTRQIVAGPMGRHHERIRDPARPVEHRGVRHGSRPRPASRPWARGRSSRRCSRRRSGPTMPAQSPGSRRPARGSSAPRSADAGGILQQPTRPPAAAPLRRAAPGPR